MTDSLPAYQEDTDSTPEYAEGKAAFLAGKSTDDNQKPKNRRYFWFMGYYDAKWARWH